MDHRSNTPHPRVVARPPSDAYIGLSLLPDGEIRHYNYGAQRRGAPPTDETGDPARTAPGWLASRDDGETWQWHDVPQGFLGADVRSPASGEWLRLVGGREAIQCIRSEGGLGGRWRQVKVVDGPGCMLKPPGFIRGGKRVLAGGHPGRGRQQPDYRCQNEEQVGCGVLLSDDDGQSWRWSQRVTVPDHQPLGTHLGTRWNHGAAEPTVVELGNGRLWMLIRTSLDRLYESFSDDGGETWLAARPSRFHATCTMPTMGRLRDGRLLLVWNNTTPLPERPTAIGVWEDVFTNRDAIHAAISADDGQTWRGFRELALDEHRHAADYAQTGGIDRSVHQSQFVQTDTGRVVVALGQHWLHRQLLVFDPDWLLETRRTAQFDAAMSEFSAQSYMKGIQGHCAYDRKAGATMVPHPDQHDRLCLHVGRRRDPDLIDERGGMVWNFPAMCDGALTLRLCLLDGFGGARLTLLDRWLNPTDPIAHALGAFTLDMPADGWLQQDVHLQPGRWHELRIDWRQVGNPHLHPGATLTVDGRRAPRRLGLSGFPCNGLSYVHLASAAADADAGLLLDALAAETVHS